MGMRPGDRDLDHLSKGGFGRLRIITGDMNGLIKRAASGKLVL